MTDNMTDDKLKTLIMRGTSITMMENTAKPWNVGARRRNSAVRSQER